MDKIGPRVVDFVELVGKPQRLFHAALHHADQRQGAGPASRFRRCGQRFRLANQFEQDLVVVLKPVFQRIEIRRLTHMHGAKQVDPDAVGALEPCYGNVQRRRRAVLGFGQPDELVQRIGNIALIYRDNPEKKKNKIIIPSR